VKQVRKLFLIGLLIFCLTAASAAADESSYAMQYLYQTPKLNYQTDLKVVAEMGSPMLAAAGNPKDATMKLNANIRLKSMEELRQKTGGDFTLGIYFTYFKIKGDFRQKRFAKEYKEGTLPGKEILLQMDSRGKVKQVKIPLPETAEPEVRLKQMAAAAELNNTARIFFGYLYNILPENAVKPGESWVVRHRISLEGKPFLKNKEFVIPIEYKLVKIYRSRGSKCALIRFNSGSSFNDIYQWKPVLPTMPDLTVQPSSAPASPASPKVTDLPPMQIYFDLLTTFQGDIIFNIDKGCIENRTGILRMQSSVESSIPNSPAPFETRFSMRLSFKSKRI
jgi:hypothetical protein